MNVISRVTENAIPYFMIKTPLIKSNGAIFCCVNDPKTFAKQLALWQKTLKAKKEHKNIVLLAPPISIEKLLGIQSGDLVLFSYETLSSNAPTKKHIEKSSLLLTKNQIIKKDELMANLDKMGYEISDFPYFEGHFAKRGGTILVHIVGSDKITYIDFFGDQIDKISEASNSSSVKNKKESAIMAPRKLKSNTTLSDFIESNQDSIFVATQKEKTILPKIKPENLIVFDYLANTKTKNHAKKIALYINKLFLLKKDIEKAKEIIIFSKLDRNEFIKRTGIKTDNKVISFFKESELDFPIGFFDIENEKLIISDFEIFKQDEETSKKPKKIDQAFISSLHAGDFVTHIDHGIGRFLGIQKQTVNKIEKEYFAIEYAQKDMLFVPIEYAEKIDKYMGSENPPIHRLSSASWNQTKRKIKEQMRDIAQKLLSLYAKRETQKGFVFEKDNEAQIELENSFPYEDTPDQAKATAEIKEDMENEAPMDRVLIGDVGFGKTEIAIRASFKAALSGKQVAILCPTTILAEQHFETFKRRMKPFLGNIVKIDYLSRFKNQKEQKHTVEQLSLGNINIIIGTHRLLSKDIKFINLGLVIIDEEQRFGVEHKERLKEIKTDADILSLSATPIPRTLNLALSGIRAISTLQTPPPGRMPIETIIESFNEEIEIDAIQKEIKRGGQVYYVYNKVASIDFFASNLREKLKNVRIAVAHGQLPEKELEAVMNDFYHHKYDVLVSSTIIENGLDIPNVNTLLVYDSTKFGLSQLYQIRGRIGRSHEKAYAYFFYQTQKMKGVAKERLEALLEAKELGSGFEIAMRDLEIRGAGNVLGREQHGNINAIGLSLYSRLLNQTIEEIRTGKTSEPRTDAKIELSIPAILPKEKFASESERMRCYQLLGNCETETEMRETLSQFSNPPYDESIENLIYLLKLKIEASRLRILNIEQKTIRPIGKERIEKIYITFFELSDELFYEIIKKYNFVEKDGNTIKIESIKLGEKWKDEFLNLIISIRNFQQNLSKQKPSATF